jgi:hypothetical protein
MSLLEQKLLNVIKLVGFWIYPNARMLTLYSSVHAAFIGVEIEFHNALEISRSKYLKVPTEDGV